MKDMFKGLTLPQALVICVLAALIVGARKFVPESAQDVMWFASLVLFGAATRERSSSTRGGGGSALVLLLCGSLLVASSQPACSAEQNRRIVDAGLTVAQIACVFASDLTDAPALAEACGVIRSPEFDAIIRRLIAQREGARKAGVRWVPLELDGGVLILVEAGPQ